MKAMIEKESFLLFKPGVQAFNERGSENFHLKNIQQLDIQRVSGSFLEFP